jgi:hypothetical protein
LEKISEILIILSFEELESKGVGFLLLFAWLKNMPSTIKP